MLNIIIWSFYFSHINGYLEANKAKPNQFLILTYENMKKDPKKEILKVANFLNTEITDKRINLIAQKTSFLAMKENPSTNYNHWDIYGLRDPKESRFMRKGNLKTVS